MALQLDRLEMREIRMRLKRPFETSFGRMSDRRILLIRVFDKSGACGYGECTAPEEPFYNHETIDTAWIIIRQFVAPLITTAGIKTAIETRQVLERIRGNRMAKAAVETAIWELEARVAGRPLWKHLGGINKEVQCGVSIGIQATTEELIDLIAHELEAGYRRIKIKIKPGKDLRLLEAARERYPELNLMADANSAYTLKDAELITTFDRFGLMMIEQPLAPGDLMDHATLQRMIKTPICLDESILDERDAQHALRLGSCRIINIKLGRVGGHAEARSIHDCSMKNGLGLWVGGMLESGIGRAHNVALSTLEGISLPGDVSASGRYWEEDIIDPPVTVTTQGTITPPDSPGIGYKVNEKRIESITARCEIVKLS